MTTFDNEIKPKISHKYFCEFCEYKTLKKSNYNSHLMSAKHIKTTNNNENKPKISLKHNCENCEKEYNDRAGLWRHKKKCLKKEKKELQESNIVQNENTITPELVIEIIELQKQMIEVIKNGSMNNSYKVL